VVNQTFDAGIFIVMLTIGFLTLIYSKKFGGVMAIPSVFCFFISGLLILSGYDVSSYTQTVTPSGILNQTGYFIGNGDTPGGTGQLWMGVGLLIMSIISAAYCLDMCMQGKIFTADKQ
jgi:hypothetical protein